jgi:ABC-2 type transport system ATP-binding protein
MSNTVIEVKNLKKHYKVAQKEPGLSGSIKAFFKREYKTVQAVNDISFEINEGELIGFIGPNGAGKTTTLKTLSGLLYPTSGKVKVLGYTPWERKVEFQKQFSLVMGQKNQLWWDLPAIESFILNKEIYGVSDQKYQSTLDDLVDLLEVREQLHTQVRKLSLGQRMKMELIAALIHSPKILFLDEPTIGLDVVMQKKLRDFIRAYNQKFNATIILTSHYMEDVKQLAERVIIIDHGTILFDGKLDAIIKKFADHKTLELVLGEQITQEKLAEFGEILEYDYPKVTIQVKRSAVSEVAAKLLSKYEIDDLNIEEAKIEDIIREVFSSEVKMSNV